MRWIKLIHKRSCERCGANVECFVRLMRNGCRATEVTFCPACSPEVKKVVDIPGINGNGGDTRRWGEAVH